METECAGGHKTWKNYKIFSSLDFFIDWNVFTMGADHFIRHKIRCTNWSSGL